MAAKYEIISKYGKSYGVFSDLTAAENFRLHLEDMYGIYDLEIVEVDK